MADDWGFVPDQDLFSSTLQTGKSLNELVENLSSSTSKGFLMMEEIQPFPLALSQAPNVEIVSCFLKKKVHSAPKILKKKNGIFRLKDVEGHTIKKVTFEVEKMVMNEGLVGMEKQAAKERLAINLGAVPMKGKKINYKQLKVERAEKKAQLKVESEIPKVSKYIQKKPKKKSQKRRNFATS